MDILVLHSELLVIVMELLYFSDKLNFSIVCKKFYKLPYIFYLDKIKLRYILSAKRVNYNEYVSNHIKNKKKINKNIKKYISFKNQRNYSENRFRIENEYQFNKFFDNSSHYLYREYDDCEKYGQYIPYKYNLHGAYNPLTINKITRETSQNSMKKYEIEGIREFFNYVNYNNIQYLFIENAQLTLIPKNIAVLTLVNCDNSEDIVFKKLEEYKNLTDINLIHFTNVNIFPDKLCSLNKLSLRGIDVLSIGNVSVNCLKIDEVYDMTMYDTFEVEELIFETYESYMDIFLQKIIIKNLKYIPGIENSKFS